MVETGTVKKIDKKNRAVVEFPRKSACDKCGMCVVRKGSMTVSVTIDNKLNAKAGDKVNVEMGDRFVLTASFIVYVIPLILVAVGILAFMSLGEIAQIIAAVSMLVLGFVIAYLLDKFVISKKKGFKPEMISILSATETEKNPDIKKDIQQNIEISDEIVQINNTENLSLSNEDAEKNR